LREVFASYGYGELSDSEVDVIIRAADVDGDGSISMEDFRYMLDLHKLPSLAQFGRQTLLFASPLTCLLRVCKCPTPGSINIEQRQSGHLLIPRERGRQR
jgi:hypothetical protein